jgi:hypothetical protein
MEFASKALLSCLLITTVLITFHECLTVPVWVREALQEVELKAYMHWLAPLWSS